MILLEQQVSGHHEPSVSTTANVDDANPKDVLGAQHLTVMVALGFLHHQRPRPALLEGGGVHVLVPLGHPSIKTVLCAELAEELRQLLERHVVVLALAVLQVDAVAQEAGDGASALLHGVLQLATVRSFINEKDNLYGEIEDLKAAASRARTLAVELEQANSRYENLRDNAAREIDQLRDTVTKLTISIEAKEAEAEEGRRASDRIQQVEQTIAVMARSHPEYFVSLLEEYKSTPDADLIVWNDVALSYTGGIRSLGAELALTLPLAVLDYRGPIRLTYGSLEVTAISMTIDLDRGMAKIGFPDDRKLRDSMALNSSTSVLVSFGPEDNRSVLAFAIGEEEEKLGMTTVPFLLNEIRLGDLPVARKDASNRWALLQ